MHTLVSVKAGRADAPGSGHRDRARDRRAGDAAPELAWLGDVAGGLIDRTVSGVDGAGCPASPEAGTGWSPWDGRGWLQPTGDSAIVTRGDLAERLDPDFVYFLCRHERQIRLVRIPKRRLTAMEAGGEPLFRKLRDGDLAILEAGIHRLTIDFDRLYWCAWWNEGESHRSYSDWYRPHWATNDLSAPASDGWCAADPQPRLAEFARFGDAHPSLISFAFADEDEPAGLALRVQPFVEPLMLAIAVAAAGQEPMDGHDSQGRRAAHAVSRIWRSIHDPQRHLFE